MMHETRPITESEQVGTRRWRRTALSAAFGLALLAVMGACTDEARDQISDAVSTTTPEGETPPPEEETPPPEEESPPPEEETPPPEEAPDDGPSDEDWLVIVLLGLAAVAIIVGATSVATRHSEAKRAAQASLASRTGQITSSAQWVHDQGSLDVLRTTDVDQLRSTWGTTRSQMVELEGRCSALASDTDDPALQDSLRQIGQCSTALRGSLESTVTLRLDPDAAAKSSLVDSATQTALERRRGLEAAIRPLAAR